MLPVRVRGFLEDVKDSLWFLPAMVVTGALVLAFVLVGVDRQEWLPDGLAFQGTPDGARAVLSELATATITVTALVFSVTVVALQMAASQFTPRLLRTFLADRRTQIVLAGLLGAAVYYVAVLRTVRSTGDEVDLFVPELAVSAAFMLGVATLGLFVFFLHHVTRQLRVDLVMDGIAADVRQQMERLESSREMLPDRLPPDPPDDARSISARRSGYLHTVDVDALWRVAVDAGVRIRLRPRLGEAVSRGTTLGWYWLDGGAGTEGNAAAPEHEGLEGKVHGTLHLGPDRTGSRDLTFGLRQLTDIAVKALSPSINDPTTATQAIEKLAAVLVQLADHPLGADMREDRDGRVRAAVPRPTFGDHLLLAVAPIRRYSQDEPDVLAALARLLTDVAEHVVDDARRAAVVRAELDLLARHPVDDPVGADALSQEIAAGRAVLAGEGRPPVGSRAEA